MQIHVALKARYNINKSENQNLDKVWTDPQKAELISLIENEGLTDLSHLGKKLKRSNDSINYIMNHCDGIRKKENPELAMNNLIEDLRNRSGNLLYENLPLFFNAKSKLEQHLDPSEVNGINYSAIFSHLASLMQGEVPPKLNPISKLKLSRVFSKFQNEFNGHVHKLQPKEEPATNAVALKITAMLKEKLKKEPTATELKRALLKERRTRKPSEKEWEDQGRIASGHKNLIIDYIKSKDSLNPFTGR